MQNRPMVETRGYIHTQEVLSMEQSNSLSEFRQGVYDNGLMLVKEAEFELVDPLLLSPYDLHGGG